MNEYLREKKALIDAALYRYLTADGDVPPRLVEAMRYSVLAGGKRVRGILVMAAAEAVGGLMSDNQAHSAGEGGTQQALPVGGATRAPVNVLPCAGALEVIHTFSLIHDDLPAMDNDDLRRGIPTNHKVYGEAMAILAGDGLLVEAFRWLAGPALVEKIPASRVLEVIADIAGATGMQGMVGGQVLDMAAEGTIISPEAVARLHRLKTGALIQVAVTSGAKLAGATPAVVQTMGQYGAAIGQAFQIADDLLGIEGIQIELGKPVGSDAARKKATYPAIAGVDGAHRRMAELTEEALHLLENAGPSAEHLRLLARYITERRF